MNHINYHKKYLKYKNKYLQEQLNIELENDAQLFADSIINLKNTDIISEVILNNLASKDIIMSVLGTIDTNEAQNHIINTIKTTLSLKKDNEELVSFITSLQSQSQNNIKNIIKNEYLNFLQIINDTTHQDKDTTSTVTVELLDTLNKYLQIGGGKCSKKFIKGVMNWQHKRRNRHRTKASRRNEKKRETHNTIVRVTRRAPPDIAIINSAGFLASLFSPIENNPDISHRMITNSDLSGTDILLNRFAKVDNIFNILKYIYVDFLNYIILILHSITNRTARENFITVIFTITIPTLLTITLVTATTDTTIPIISSIIDSPSVGIVGGVLLTKVIAPTAICMSCAKVSQYITTEIYKTVIGNTSDIDTKLITLSSKALLWPTVNLEKGHTLTDTLASVTVRLKPNMMALAHTVILNLNSIEFTKHILRRVSLEIFLAIGAVTTSYRSGIGNIPTDAPLDNIVILASTLITTDILVSVIQGIYRLKKSISDDITVDDEFRDILREPSLRDTLLAEIADE